MGVGKIFEPDPEGSVTLRREEKCSQWGGQWVSKVGRWCWVWQWGHWDAEKGEWISTRLEWYGGARSASASQAVVRSSDFALGWMGGSDGSAGPFIPPWKV